MALYSTLTEPKREALFALMRELQADSDFYMAKGRETPGTIPVGAALFDDVIKGAARLELLLAIGRADTLEAVEALAVPALRLWVTKHNERRRDKDWRRWTEHGQDVLRFLLTRVRTILAP